MMDESQFCELCESNGEKLVEANKRIADLEAIPTEGIISIQFSLIKRLLEKVNAWFNTNDEDKEGLIADDLIEQLSIFAEALPRANRRINEYESKINFFQSRIDAARPLIGEAMALGGSDMEGLVKGDDPVLDLLDEALDILITDEPTGKEGG